MAPKACALVDTLLIPNAAQVHTIINASAARATLLLASWWASTSHHRHRHHMDAPEVGRLKQADGGV